MAPTDHVNFNYSVDAGNGSRNFCASDAWRRTLLGTVAAGALFFGYTRTANAGCTSAGPTVTCTGDLNDPPSPFVVDNGTVIPQTGYNTLNVNNLDADITPGSGTDGINFERSDANVGDIVIDTEANITTIGLEAEGIFAESGVETGSGDATSGAVTVTQTGDIETAGFNSDGIEASSKADAAGSGDATAGTVVVTQTGAIETTLNDSDGIEASSYAAAHSGSNATAGAVTVTQTGDIQTAGFGSLGIEASSKADAAGGGNATADAVAVTQFGGIETTLNNSDGIKALSLANAEDNGDATSGAVTVTQTGDIETAGFNSDGIHANSSADAAGGGSATSGTVAVTQFGGIETILNNSDGIEALSLANAEDNGDATAGAITVTQTGDIETAGFNSEGIYAKSLAVTDSGIATNGTIDITLNGGAIRSTQAEGVEFVGGADNTLTINNTVSISGGTTDVLGGDGDETIRNFGTLTTPGDIDLGAGLNAFNNYAGAIFNSGNRVNLGAGNTLTNDGYLSPGGVDSIATTALTGNLDLEPGGALVVDVDPVAVSDNADLIDMTAGSGQASAAGGVAVHFSQLTGTAGDQFLLIETNQEVLVQGLQLSAAVNAEIEYLDSETDVVLTLTSDDLIDFVPNGLNRNQTNIGQSLDVAFDVGAPALDPVFNSLLYYTFGLDAYKDALDQLSPEIYADTQLAALYSSLDFSNNLLSCRINGRDAAAINKQGQCVWAAAKWRETDRDATSQNIGFDEQAWQFAGGVQVALDPVWRLNFGLGYQNTSLDTDTGAKSDGDMVQGGVALKYNPGALLLAGIVSGGRGWYDTTRPMAFGNFAATADGDYDIDVFQGRLHASYVMGAPSLFFKPMIDAAATYVGLDDVNESYANGAGLNVHGNGETIYSLAPAVEVGTEWWTTAGTLIRPFVRGGVTWFSEDDVTVSASFAGAPDGVGPFSIRASTDEVLYDLSAGLEMITAGETNFRVFYDGHFGDETTIHSVGLKGSAKF